MTSHDALAVIGAIVLLRLAVVALSSATARVRAARAVATLVGNIYWRSDAMLTRVHPHAWLGYEPARFHRRRTPSFPPAAEVGGVIPRRLPRGWVSTGLVIDVQMKVQS